MLRKVLMSAFIISLIVSLYTVKAFAAEHPTPEQFSDLPTGWSRDSVVNAINKGLLYGVDGKILPKDNLTRAQLAAIVNRAFGTGFAADLSSFSDVSFNTWYYDDLSYAVGNRTVVGFNNQLFPDRDATREEVFAVLARVVKPEPVSDLTSIELFNDYDMVSRWAVYDLAAMIESGYMHGANGMLQPKTKITREEFAYVIDQFSDMFVGVEQEISSNEPEPYNPPEFEFVPSEQLPDDSDESLKDEINSDSLNNDAQMIDSDSFEEAFNNSSDIIGTSGTNNIASFDNEGTFAVPALLGGSSAKFDSGL